MSRYTITATVRATHELFAVPVTATSLNKAMAAADAIFNRAPAGVAVIVADTKPRKGVSDPQVLRSLYKQTPDEKRAAAIRYVERRIADACETTRTLNEFIATLRDNVEKPQADPTYPLGWSDNVFRDAATLYVGRCLQARVDANEGVIDVPALYAYALDSALRGARSPSFSTSTASNLMALYTTAAWATIAEKIDHARLAWAEAAVVV